MSGQNTGYQNLKLKYSELQTECADLGLRYLLDHPKVESCTARVAVARQSLEGGDG